MTVSTSIVIPVFNEAECIGDLLLEIDSALAAQERYEVVVVNDGSEDATVERVKAVTGAVHYPLRLISHRRRSGQSAALISGVRQARGEWIATLDGDGQNDPADVPTLLEELRAAWQSDGRSACVAGVRQRRRDGWVKRTSSNIANGVRRRVLADGIADTGCGAKAFRRDVFLSLPAFDHLHRFIPALLQAAGWRVLVHDVNHRPRAAGRSKYGIGNRLWVGIVDLFGVRWLQRRALARLDEIVLD